MAQKDYYKDYKKSKKEALRLLGSSRLAIDQTTKRMKKQPKDKFYQEMLYAKLNLALSQNCLKTIDCLGKSLQGWKATIDELEKLSRKNESKKPAKAR
jgi:hypothetical protein